MKRDNKDMKVLLESWRGYVSADAEVLTEGEHPGKKPEERGPKKKMKEAEEAMEEGMHGDDEKMEEGMHPDDLPRS